MLRFINTASIIMLLASSIYAYSVKYQTIFYAEQIVKLKHAIDKEADKIADLRAEWAGLIQPQRVRDLSDKYLDLQQLSLNQIANFVDLPERNTSEDTIGHKLEQLGITNSPSQVPSQLPLQSPSLTPSLRVTPTSVPTSLHNEAPSHTRVRTLSSLITTTPH